MTEFDDDNETSGDLLADLRRQLKQKDKDLRMLQEQLGDLSKKDRARTLADTLKAHNVPDKVAKFYPSDKAASEEDVKAWLTENADVFGLKLDAPPADEPAAPPVPEGLNRLQQLSSPSVPEGTDSAVLHQINQAASADELVAMIMAAGGGQV